MHLSSIYSPFILFFFSKGELKDNVKVEQFVTPVIDLLLFYYHSDLFAEEKSHPFKKKNDKRHERSCCLWLFIQYLDVKHVALLSGPVPETKRGMQMKIQSLQTEVKRQRAQGKRQKQKETGEHTHTHTQ